MNFLVPRVREFCVLGINCLLLKYIYVWIYENGAKELNSRPKQAFFSRQKLQSREYKN